MLHSIRGSVEADRARFNSGNYPYRHSERRHDVNDPRIRAETVMDVTVMSHPTPLGGSGGSALVVGYVYQHVNNDSKIPTMQMPGRSKRFRHVTSDFKIDVDDDVNGSIHPNRDNDDCLMKMPA